MTMLLESFAPLFQLQRDLNRFLAPEGAAGSYLPAADVLVTDDNVTVHIDVPGLRAENVDIDLENDVLTVRGERAFPYDTNGSERAWQRLERGFGRFERVLRVPQGLDADAIEATMEDGVLTLRIPKPEPLKPHRIQIKGGASNGSRQLEGASAE